MAFSFLQKNEGSRHDTLLTAHFERAIIITVRHDEPLTSQSATAGGHDNTSVVATPSCLSREKMVRIMRCTIYRNGVFSAFILFPPSQRELLAGHGRLSFALYIYFSFKKGLTRTLMRVYNTCAIKKRQPRRKRNL